MFAYCPLASGSKGNCIVVKTAKTTVLIDCGLNLKTLKNRLAQVSLSLENIDAIFITHEHSDHIQGLKTVTSNYNIPILCNASTADAIAHYFQECIPCHLFTTYETFHWKDIEVHPFSVSHDAVDPVGFRLQSQGVTLGLCADIGFVSAMIPEMLSKCHLLYIESNHEPLLVHASKRPLIYKQRVLSKMGHLSNEACAKLLLQIAHSDLRHIYLAHLSQDCNEPKLACEIMKKHLRETPFCEIPVEVALQGAPSGWVYSCSQSEKIFSKASHPITMAESMAEFA